MKQEDTVHEVVESPFLRDFQEAVQRLRGSLTELLVPLGADPLRPQEVSRHLGINKNLAWKISRIVAATDNRITAAHVPGANGLKILLEAAGRHGATEAGQRGVRDAAAEFDRMVKRHAGDRSTLDVLLAPTAPDSVLEESIEASRKLAYQGNSAIWGVQARVRQTTFILAPNAADPGFADVAAIGGMLDFRRLRSAVTWPLARSQGVHDDGTPFVQNREPLDPTCEDPGLPVLREFSSSPLPPTRAIPSESGITYELCEGPVGNTAAFSYLVGFVSRRVVPIHETANDRYGEHPTALDTPVELFQGDVFLHKSFPFGLPPEPLLYSWLFAEPDHALAARPPNLLPLPETVQSLGAGPPMVTTPHLPQYSEMIRWVFKRLDWPMEDFRGYRLVLRYPPIPSRVVLRYGLVPRTG